MRRQLVLYALWLYTCISLWSEYLYVYKTLSHGQTVHQKKVWIRAIMSEVCVQSRNKTIQKATCSSQWAFNVCVQTSKLTYLQNTDYLFSQLLLLSKVDLVIEIPCLLSLSGMSIRKSLESYNKSHKIFHLLLLLTHTSSNMENNWH